ncbi:MAG TPA: alpha/beta fold hydrolase [Telluria sp.]|nr:alpha/beta fold hydrolase [Telluria sp.]
MSEAGPHQVLTQAERLASAWQGLLDGDSPERELAPAAWDMLLNASLGRMTSFVSPAAVALAYTDWLAHLTLSPAKREELVLKFWKKMTRWLWYAAQAMGPQAGRKTIDPLPQDKRFIDPAWQRWPFNVISQGFLLEQQWWHCATTGVRGMSAHHEHVVTFITRQLLDMWAPSNFLLTNPVVQDATWRAKGMNLLNGMQRASADWRRAIAGERNPAWDQFKVGETLAVTPGRVVYRNELMELIQYAPATSTVHAVPVLFIPAWIMKYYILDLTPEESLVRYLVGQGHTVFMISWKNPDAAQRGLGMDDYLHLGVRAAMDQALRITGAAQVNAVGYCLGGTLLSIAAAELAREHDRRLASVTMFAAQTDFTEPGELSLFIDDSQVSFLEASMWDQGYLNPRQMAGAFQLLRSNDLVWSRRLNEYLLDQPEPRTGLMAWNADATRMPFRMHSEYLRQLFLDNELAEGRYRVDGQPVALTDIRVPMFAVGTLTDHVAPWRSVYKLLLLADTEVTFLLTTGGHNAGVVSPPGHPRRSFQMATHAADAPYVDPETWQATTPRREGSWWPAWEQWLAEHAGPKIAPPKQGKSLGAAPGTYVLER